MGNIRGELYTTQVTLDNRSYFFNVKENRAGDIFLQIVESKKGEGIDFDRHQISIFAEDMQKVLRGLDDSLKFIERERKERSKRRAARKAAKSAPSGEERPDDGIRRTGRVIHISSKRETAQNKDE